MENDKKPGINVNLLMGEVVILMQTIKARIESMNNVDEDKMEGESLACLYEDIDSLQRLYNYFESEFEIAFGAFPEKLSPEYQSALSKPNI